MGARVKWITVVGKDSTSEGALFLTNLLIPRPRRAIRAAAPRWVSDSSTSHSTGRNVHSYLTLEQTLIAALGEAAPRGNTERLTRSTIAAAVQSL